MDTKRLNNSVCIVGAGLTGTLLSIILAKKGFKVHLYEKRPDIREHLVSGNRTIAMSISARGIRGLQRGGLSKEIIDNTIPKHSRKVHKRDGSLLIQQYGKDGDTINTVDRRELNSKLLNEAERTGNVHFFANQKCFDVNPSTGALKFRNEKTGKVQEKKYSRIIGADGIFSDLRKNLEKKGCLRSELKRAKYGYRELIIPSDKFGGYQLDNQCVHVWPRKDYILVGLPGFGGKFTCNLFLPYKGELSLKEITTEKQIHQLFKRDFSTIMPLMPNLVEDYFNHAASDIFTVKCDSWNYKDKFLLVGDAAHAIVPFFAMGMNVGFEDCTIFDNLMNDYSNDLSKVFENFGQCRKPDVDVISDLSFRNFSDISKSPDENYHKIWELERALWDLHPNKWMPFYSMIAFSHMPFREVLHRNGQQKKIIQELLKVGIVEINRKTEPKVAELLGASFFENKMAEFLNV